MREFLKDIVRYNSIDTYLNTFVSGIEQHTNSNDYLRPKFMQCVTATGRLSSRDPNFQNQPRGNTFPIRKAVISRFKNGKIMEMDFSQLEFRTAVFLAQDEQGMEDIKNGVDVHQYTADVIGCSRQEAKAHTFKPLYGGVTGTENEKNIMMRLRKNIKTSLNGMRNYKQKLFNLKLLNYLVEENILFQVLKDRLGEVQRIPPK